MQLLSNNGASTNELKSRFNYANSCNAQKKQGSKCDSNKKLKCDSNSLLSRTIWNNGIEMGLWETINTTKISLLSFEIPILEHKNQNEPGLKYNIVSSKLQ